MSKVLGLRETRQVVGRIDKYFPTRAAIVRRLQGGPHLRTGVLGHILDSIPPAAGAAVMGSGIISIALTLDGQETLSKVTLAIAALLWVTLAMLLPLRAVRDPAAFLSDARSPAALNAPVATAVVGTRLALLGWAGAGIAGLVIAVVLWAALLGPVLAAWKSPTVGVSFMPAVSAESLAVLAATLAAPEHAGWLLIAAFILFGLGLGLYVFVLSRFDMHQLAVGRGDHWIVGGALGMSALAAGKIEADATALDLLRGSWGSLEDIALGLWVLTMLWLVVLLFAEARWPRIRYNGRRWSTVFPLGMYAASSFVVGVVAHVSAITTFARVWVWIALGSWTIVFVTSIQRAIRVMRGGGTNGRRDNGRTRGGRTADPIEAR